MFHKSVENTNSIGNRRFPMEMADSPIYWKSDPLGGERSTLYRTLNPDGILVHDDDDMVKTLIMYYEHHYGHYELLSTSTTAQGKTHFPLCSFIVARFTPARLTLFGRGISGRLV